MEDSELDFCIRNFKRTKDDCFFEKIYRGYYPRILRFAAMNLGNTSDAEETASEVFVKAYRFMKNMNLNSTSFKPWIYKIARNLVIDHYRKEARQENTVSLDQYLEEDPSGIDNERLNEKALTFEDDQEKFSQPSLEKNFINENFLTNLSSLPDLQKQVLLLRYVEDLDYKSIGRILNKNEVAVRAIKFRAITKLRELMK